MAVKWKALYYEEKPGFSPVQDFMDSRSLRNKAKIMSQIAVLEEYGPRLPRPYADFLEDGIYELRIRLSGDQVRILYFFCYKHYIVLTHTFTKKTDRVPTREIEKAKNAVWIL